MKKDSIGFQQMSIQEEKTFIDYCMGFYGPAGVFVKDLTKPFTEAELQKGLEILKITKVPEYDSVDREWVRDIVLAGRGEKAWGVV